jgi:hypothetical protein
MSTDVGSIVGYLRLDGTQFRDEVAQAIAELKVLSGTSVNIDVKTDKLREVEPEAANAERGLRNLDTELKNVGSNGQRSTGMLLSSILLLGPALVPLAAGAAGLGLAFGGMAAAGIVAFMGIKNEMAQGTAVGRAYQAGINDVTNAMHQLGAVAASNILGAFQTIVSDVIAKMPVLTGEIGNLSTMLGHIGASLTSGLLNVFTQLAPYIEQAVAQVTVLAAQFDTFTLGNGFAKFAGYVLSEMPDLVSFMGQLLTLVSHLVQALLPFGAGILSALEVFIGALNQIPLDMLTTLATVALSVFAGFKTWEAITGIVEAVVETLKGLNTALEISEGVMKTVSLATSVVGIAVAAFSMILSHNAEASEEAKQKQEAYADALRASKGAIDDNVRAVAAKALEEEGALQIAEQLGISLSTVTSATLGQKDALAQLNPQIASIIANNQLADTGWKSGVPVLGERAQLAKKLQEAISGQNNALQAQIRTQKAVDEASAVTQTNMTAEEIKAKNLAQTYNMSVSVYQAAAKAQADDAAQLAATTAKMQLENDAAGLLKAALDRLNGKAISAAQAQQQFDNSLVSMTKAQNSAGKAVHITSGNINSLTTASVTVRGELNQQITALEGVVEANGGLSNSTGAARAQMERMRTQIINNAVAHGVDRAAVTRYIDTILKIPRSVPPTKLQVDKSQAVAAINSFKATLASVEGRVVTTYVRTVTSTISAMAQGIGGAGGVSGHGMLRKRYGGIESFFDGGFHQSNFQSFAAGKLPSQAMIAPDGANLVQWAESGTGGEAFIPLNSGNHAKSVAVWEETGRRLGVRDQNSGLVTLSPESVEAVAAAVQRGTEAGAARGTAAGMSEVASQARLHDRLRNGVSRP